MEFLGYERSDGFIGVRNHILILPSTGCANTVTIQIANQIRGVLAVTHSQGCGQLGEDQEQTYRTLIGIGKNPNIAACLVVGLGCEQVSADKLADNIAATGKLTESIIALDEGE
ncbi:MAG: UxaA family hydrolase [Candidatus Methanomethylicia archaeon]